MPIAGARVAKELEQVCTKDSCTHLNDWLNELYSFKLQLDIYRQELN